MQWICEDCLFMVEILGYYHIECQILISFVDFGEREDRKTLWFSAVCAVIRCTCLERNVKSFYEPVQFKTKVVG